MCPLGGLFLKGVQPEFSPPSPNVDPYGANLLLCPYICKSQCGLYFDPGIGFPSGSVISSQVMLDPHVSVDSCIGHVSLIYFQQVFFLPKPWEELCAGFCFYNFPHKFLIHSKLRDVVFELEFYLEGEF